MADLRVDFDALKEVSGSVASKGEEFQDLLNTIKNYNEELRSAWEGTDQVAYADAVARQAEVMQKLAEAIAEISAFLDNVNRVYQDAQEENRSAINY